MRNLRHPGKQIRNSPAGFSKTNDVMYALGACPSLLLLVSSQDKGGKWCPLSDIKGTYAFWAVQLVGGK